MKRILIACEFSGIVRDEFASMGFFAQSCDLLESENPGLHYSGDVLDIIDDGWDMMIAFPPCTYLCSSGLHWNSKRPERELLTEHALIFVDKLLDANIKHIALENPLGCINTRIRKYDQMIQPWQFGHPESKLTCLWLKNLPKLKPTNILHPPSGLWGDKSLNGKWENITHSGQNKIPPSPVRWMDRSRTYKGIASAMAQQWGEYIKIENKNPGDVGRIPPVATVV